MASSSPTESVDEPQPMFYITRSNGLHVALVPADELPLSVELSHFPRTFISEPKHPWHHCGTFGPNRPYHDLQLPPTFSNSPFSIVSVANNNLDASARKLIERATSATSTISPSTLYPNPSTLPGSHPLPAHPGRNSLSGLANHTPTPSLQTHPSLAPLPSHNAFRPLPPSGMEPDLGKKIFCTHWIKTGECAFMQQGCLYKHEMPDRETLGRIGFAAVPTWWQVRHALSTGGGGGARQSNYQQQQQQQLPQYKQQQQLPNYQNNHSRGYISGRSDVNGSNNVDARRWARGVAVARKYIGSGSGAAKRQQPPSSSSSMHAERRSPVRQTGDERGGAGGGGSSSATGPPRSDAHVTKHSRMDRSKLSNRAMRRARQTRFRDAGAMAAAVGEIKVVTPRPSAMADFGLPARPEAGSADAHMDERVPLGSVPLGSVPLGIKQVPVEDLIDFDVDEPEE